MSTWLQVIFFSFIGSVASLAGGVYMLSGWPGARLLQKIAVPFAAGALLAAAFFDLLPEALETAEANIILGWTLAGFLSFFIAERGLRWFHHHHAEDQPHQNANRVLVVVGDTLHNFIDGLAVGATFLASPLSGIVTALAVSAHEVPREIGDFGLLLSKGMSRAHVFWVSFWAALAGVVGAALVFGSGKLLPLPVSELLALTAGFFIYIAASDVIPTIHQNDDRKLANIETIVLLCGTLLVAVIIWVIKYFFTI